MNDINEILNETSGLYNDAQTTLENVLVLHENVSKIVNEKLPDVDNKILDNENKINNHINDKDNPHNVTKEQVGLGNVDNTSDLDKPISTATQSALDEKLNNSNVVQTTGTSEIAVMSQKAVTDELNLKANTSEVIKKESTEMQTIVANQLTPLALKSNVDNSGYIGFRKADNSIIGTIGFGNGKASIVEGGEEKTLLKTLPQYSGKVDNYIDGVWENKDGWRVYHYADKTLECWKTMTFTTGAINVAWGVLKISTNYIAVAYPFTLNERIVEDCFVQDNPAGVSLMVIKNTFGNAQISPQYKVARPMETATQTISVTLYAKAKVNW